MIVFCISLVFMQMNISYITCNKVVYTKNDGERNKNKNGENA